MENENIDVPQEQQIQGGDDKLKQAHTSLLKLGYEVPEKFDEFKKAASDPKYLENVHKSLIKNDYDVPTNFSTFKTDMGFGEKKNSTPNSKPTPNNLQGGVQTQQPTSTSSQLGVNNGNAQLPTDPITALRGYKSELDRPTKQLPESRGETVVYSDDPADIEVKKKAGLDYQKALDNLSTQLGVKKEYAEKVINDFGHIANPQDIKERADLLQNNPSQYDRLQGHEVSQHILYPALTNAINDPNIPIEERAKIKMAKENLIALRNNNNQDASVNADGTSNINPDVRFSNSRYYFQSANDLINKYVTDEKKRNEAKKGIAQEMAYNYANVPQQTLQQIKESNPSFSDLNDNQLSALAYLQDASPEKYKSLVAMMPNDKRFLNDFHNSTEEQRLANEENNKYLENIGITIKGNYLKEQMANIAKKQTDGSITQEDLSTYNSLQEDYNKLLGDKDAMRVKYPLSNREDVSGIAQELSGEANKGYFHRLVDKTAGGIGDIGSSIWDATVTPFRSEENQKKRFLQLAGESTKDENSNYVLQQNRFNQTMGSIVTTPELQKQIDEIKNSKDYYKQNKIEDLLNANQKDWYVKKPNDKTNYSWGALAYGMGDVASSIVPFVAAAYLTGGMSAEASVTQKMASTFTSVFATGYEENLKQAIKDGVENPTGTAMRRTAIQGMAFAVGDEVGAIKAAFMKTKSPMAEIVAKMSDKEIESALQGNKYFNNLVKDLPKQTIEAVKASGRMAGISTVGTLANDAWDNKVKTASEYAHEFGASFLNMFSFNMLGAGYKAISNASDLHKQAFYHAATNPKEAFKAIDEKVANGEFDAEKAAQIKQNITKAADVLDNIEMIDSKGRPITNEKDKVDLLFHKIKEIGATEFLKKDIPESQKTAAEEDVNKAKADQKDIYKNAQSPYIIQGEKVSKEDFVKAMKDETLKGKQWHINEGGDQEILKNAVDNFGGKYDEKKPNTATNQTSNAEVKPITTEEKIIADEGVGKATQPTEKITKEAQDLLDSGGVPSVVTNNLKRIATENGIEVTDATKPQEIIDGLKNKIKPTEEVKVEEPNVSDVKEGSVGVGGDGMIGNGYKIPSDKSISKSLEYLNEEDGKNEFSDVNAAKDLLTETLGAKNTGASSYSVRTINGKKVTIRISDHEGYQPDVYINHPNQASIPETDNMIDIVLDKKERDYPDEDDFLAVNNKYQRIHVTVPEFESEAHAKRFIEKVIDRINEDEEFALKEQSLKETPKAETTSKPIVEEQKVGFTEAKDLNKMFTDLKSKYGEKKGNALYEVANRLVNPNENEIVEIRSNGVVVKEGDKYILKPFGNTDASSKKWTLYKGLDVTDQFKTETKVETPKENIFIESDNPIREGKSKKALIEARKEVFEKYKEAYGENVKEKVKDINTNFDDYIKSLKEIGEIIKIEC